MMQVRNFRLAELDAVAVGAVNARVNGLQPHRVMLGELDWLTVEEALWPIGTVRPAQPVARVGLGPKSVRR